MTRTHARIPEDARILVEVGSKPPSEVGYESMGPFEMLWVVTNGTMRRKLFWITLKKSGIYFALGREGNFHLSYHTDGTFHTVIGDSTVPAERRTPLLELQEPTRITGGTIVVADDALDHFRLTEFGDQPVDRIIYLDNRKLPPAICYDVWAVPPFKHAEVPLHTTWPAHVHLVTHTVPWIEVIIYEQGARDAGQSAPVGRETQNVEETDV